MTYQHLARKYRPSRFDEMVGQSGTAKALANAIVMGREPHALLFTGVRGIGKTTAARLYAKALNCTYRSIEAEPCNQCESCEAITSGRHEDVLEIDGASNTSVNDVRALQETIYYVPQRSKFKIYIVDEVHMLSQSAFNALLKTLEEPPSHVVFVFATTEIAKVPETILSRCQAFYLKKLTRLNIQERLKEICKFEGLTSEDRALTVIAREGHGSMRDALTLLDQAIAIGDGAVTLASLAGMFAHISSTPYISLLGALVDRDGKSAIEIIAQLDENGAEFSKVVEETASYARHAFVLKSLGKSALQTEALGLDEDEKERIWTLVDRAAPFDLNRIFRTLTKARLDLDGSTIDRFILENYLLEWCLDPGLPDLASLLDQAPRHRSGEKSVVSQPVTKPVTASQSVQEHVVQDSGRNSSGREPGGREPSRKLMAASAILAQSSSGAPTQQPPPVAAPPKDVEKLCFPPTWRQLLDAWREHKPLSARKLEDTHLIEYSPAGISLAVSDQSYISKSLLQREDQIKIREQLSELFGFSGSFVVQQLAPHHQALPKTVLHERQKESEQKREATLEASRNAPLTKAITTTLGATIEDVRMLDQAGN